LLARDLGSEASGKTVSEHLAKRRISLDHSFWGLEPQDAMLFEKNVDLSFKARLTQ
jgi:hypothetical protein